VMALADRILVMCGGRIVGELPADQADERKLGLLMANVAGREASETRIARATGVVP
jgi:general nucleoside transport system ATP-binding protein